MRMKKKMREYGMNLKRLKGHWRLFYLFLSHFMDFLFDKKNELAKLFLMIFAFF